MVYGLVERGIGRDGNAWVALKSCGGEDMNLDSGAIKSRIACRRRAMENKHWQMSQNRVSRVVETDLVLRQYQLVGDSDHGDAEVYLLVDG